MTDLKNTATTFASLSLAASSLDNLTQLGYTQMTPIQAARLRETKVVAVFFKSIMHRLS